MDPTTHTWQPVPGNGATDPIFAALRQQLLGAPAGPTTPIFQRVAAQFNPQGAAGVDASAAQNVNPWSQSQPHSWAGQAVGGAQRFVPQGDTQIPWHTMDPSSLLPHIRDQFESISHHRTPGTGWM